MVVNREMFTLLFTPTKKHLQILLCKCLIINVGVVGFELNTAIIMSLFDALKAVCIGWISYFVPGLARFMARFFIAFPFLILLLFHF